MVSLAQWWSGTRLKIFATDEDAKMFGKENAYIIMVYLIIIKKSIRILNN